MIGATERTVLGAGDNEEVGRARTGVPDVLDIRELTRSFDFLALLTFRFERPARREGVGGEFISFGSSPCRCSNMRAKSSARS